MNALPAFLMARRPGKAGGKRHRRSGKGLAIALTLTAALLSLCACSAPENAAPGVEPASSVAVSSSGIPDDGPDGGADIVLPPSDAPPSQLDPSQEPPLRDVDLQIAVPDFLNEEQQTLYRRAYSFNHLFYGESGAVDDYPTPDEVHPPDDMEWVDMNGIRYYFAWGRYRLWSDFYNSMLAVFTEDRFHALNQEQIFVEHDGRLCYMDVSAVCHPGQTDEVSFELISKTDSEIVFEITRHYQEETGGSFIKVETVSLTNTEHGWRVDGSYTALADEDEQTALN